MESGMIIFFFICIIILPTGIILYRQFSFARGIQKSLKEISDAISDILENDSDEMVMTFTDNKAVMELINRFFTLAKLEAGDMNMEITRINISEVCRENVLGFYELLLQRNLKWIYRSRNGKYSRREIRSLWTGF